MGALETTSALSGVAGSPAGYVVLDWGRTVWFSPDGRSWTKSTLPFQTSTSNGVDLTAHANAIIGGRTGFVVVGGYDHTPCVNEQTDGGPPPCVRRPISWSSTDGINWTSSLPNPIPANGTSLPKYSEMVLIWAAGDGWDASVEARDNVRYHGNTLLHSKDGLAWTRLKSPPLPQGSKSGDDVQAHGGAGTPDGERIVWQYAEDTGEVAGVETTLSTTRDGVTWAGAPGFDGKNAIVRFVLAPWDDPDAWLLAGDTFVAGSNRVIVWRSDNWVEWHSALPTNAGVPLIGISALGHWTGRFIALGWQDGQLRSDPPSTWLSDDGWTWTSVDAASQRAIDSPDLMADGPAGLLGIGTDESGETGAAAWLAVKQAP